MTNLGLLHQAIMETEDELETLWAEWNEVQENLNRGDQSEDAHLQALRSQIQDTQEHLRDLERKLP